MNGALVFAIKHANIDIECYKFKFLINSVFFIKIIINSIIAINGYKPNFNLTSRFYKIILRKKLIAGLKELRCNDIV